VVGAGAGAGAGAEYFGLLAERAAKTPVAPTAKAAATLLEKSRLFMFLVRPV
jgi:hypothetical protein